MRPSEYLNPFMEMHERFQPQQIESELIQELQESSKTFVLNGRPQNYNHNDPIFTLSGPVEK